MANVPRGPRIREFGVRTSGVMASSREEDAGQGEQRILGLAAFTENPEARGSKAVKDIHRVLPSADWLGFKIHTKAIENACF